MDTDSFAMASSCVVCISVYNFVVFLFLLWLRLPSLVLFNDDLFRLGIRIKIIVIARLQLLLGFRKRLQHQEMRIKQYDLQ